MALPCFPPPRRRAISSGARRPRFRSAARRGGGFHAHLMRLQGAGAGRRIAAADNGGMDGRLRRSCLVSPLRAGIAALGWADCPTGCELDLIARRLAPRNRVW